MHRPARAFRRVPEQLARSLPARRWTGPRRGDRFEGPRFNPKPTRPQLFPMTADSTPQVPPAASGIERRQWPRAKADWPISLELPEGRYEARVRDISEAGVCFFLDRPVNLMTQLAIELDLPNGDEMLVIRGKGIVVRSEKLSERIDHYEVAVFMPDFNTEERSAIADFVADHPEYEPKA